MKTPWNLKKHFSTKTLKRYYLLIENNCGSYSMNSGPKEEDDSLQSLFVLGESDPDHINVTCLVSSLLSSLPSFYPSFLPSLLLPSSFLDIHDASGMVPNPGNMKMNNTCSCLPVILHLSYKCRID